jgi:hypothetical protein
VPLNTWQATFQWGNFPANILLAILFDRRLTHSTMKSVQLGRAVTRFTCSGLYQRSYSVVHDAPQTAGSLAHTPIPPPPQRTSSLLEQAANATAPRSNWTKDEITEIHQTPLMELAFAAVCSRHGFPSVNARTCGTLKPQPSFKADAMSNRAPYIVASISLQLFNFVH